MRAPDTRDIESLVDVADMQPAILPRALDLLDGARFDRIASVPEMVIKVLLDVLSPHRLVLCVNCEDLARTSDLRELLLDIAEIGNEQVTGRAPHIELETDCLL